jgi:hypothetical protein
MLKLTVEDFASLMGAKVSDLDPEIRKEIESLDLSYARLAPSERDAVILGILTRTNSPTLAIAGREDKSRWHDRWQQNLNRFKQADYALAALAPEYVKAGAVIRLNGDYAKPFDPHFEENYYRVFRQWLFGTYLANVPAVYEFGSGTGHNLVALAGMFPECELHGFEWVSPPVRILQLLRQRYGFNVEGHVFDMRAPDPDFRLKPGSAVVTIGSMEQLGGDFEAFLQYTIAQRPAIVIQVNHFTEMYDSGTLFDYLAAQFERRRNYLRGYLPRLQELAEKGTLDILAAHHCRFGSTVHDGYSYVVWRPKQ